MRVRALGLLSVLAVVFGQNVLAEGPATGFPKTIQAGSGFSALFAGGGKATLYIIGPQAVLKREIQLGEITNFAPGSLYNAGHYLALVEGDSDSATYEFDVVAATRPAELSFLARPSRLPVGIHDGITGAVYVFDEFHNLITTGLPVHFELSNPSGDTQTRDIITRDGAAWTAMDSGLHQGSDRFSAATEGISSARVIRQVPGDPCGLKMSASPAGNKVQLVTEPLRDCNGNAIPDGTIVTFTETYNGAQSTVDVPLKRGIAEVQMPSHSGATISAASGVVLGKQIRWER
jgi:hypothetical protein